MPTALIQRNPNKVIYPALRAAEGFGLLGYVVEWFDELPESLEDCIVAGYIPTVREAVRRISGIAPEIFNYPNSLLPFTGREISTTTLGEVRNSPHKWPIFMKPAGEIKAFTGVLVQNIRGLYSSSTLPPETPVHISTPKKFLSEYRCFIQNGQIVGCRPYKGDPLVFPNPDRIREMIAAWTDSPAAYCLDVGIDDVGETLLIEINDGYAAGCYGLDPLIYARWLETRWCQLTGSQPIP